MRSWREWIYSRLWRNARSDQHVWWAPTWRTSNQQLSIRAGVEDGVGAGLVEDGEAQLFRKRMFLENNFVDMVDYMLEDTLYNLMEEATYEEFDLKKEPKIHIRKDGESGPASN